MCEQHGSLFWSINKMDVCESVSAPQCSATWQLFLYKGPARFGGCGQLNRGELTILRRKSRSHVIGIATVVTHNGS